MQYRDILNRFGTPERVAESWLEETAPDVILRGMHYGTRLTYIFLYAVILVIAIWLGAVTIALKSDYNQARGSLIVEIVDGTAQTTDGGVN